MAWKLLPIKLPPRRSPAPKPPSVPLAPKPIMAPAPAGPAAQQAKAPTPFAHLPSEDLAAAGLTKTSPNPLTPAPQATARALSGPAPPVNTAPLITSTEGAAADSWFFVSRLGEFPGNFPPVDQLRAVGITGVAMQPSDPLFGWGVGEAHRLSFKAMAWDSLSNYNNNPQQFIDALAQGAKSAGVDAVGVDVETQAKGPPGSDAWKLSQTVASLAASELAGIPWAVVPIRSADDFDFAAYTNAGGTVIIQTYGANPLTDLFDPVEVVRLAISSGVPANRISVLMSPVQATTQNLAALRALGITSVSLYRQDGLGVAAANAAGFPVAAPSAAPAASTESAATAAAAEAVVAEATAAEGVAPADGVDYETVAVDETVEPVPVAGDDPPDALGDTTASLAPLLEQASGLRTLSAVTARGPSPLQHTPAPPGAVMNALDRMLADRQIPQRWRLAIRAAILVWMKGIPYVWGGTDPNRGLDCSGFVQYVLRIAGVTSLARTTYQQAKQGRLVAPAHRQVLDLCFFEPQRAGPGHVALYIADGWALHEPHTGTVAQWLNTANWTPMETRRYLPNLIVIGGHAETAKALTPPKPTPKPATPKPVAAENAWAQLRRRVAVTWPNYGQTARRRGDQVMRAVDSGR